ncbi:MAG: TPM domain-containing protein [Candidatus Omnitrophica bacterium]|nr:TPM domain-containing protein [Candidatus Omnitrophota bacterium]
MRGIRILLGLTLAGVVAVSSAWALEIPRRPDNYVTDKAELISAPTESRLNAYLREVEAKTTNQIVVVTFPGLEGESLEDFSIRLAEVWKIGQKGRDNGVIFLIFRDDRKMRIEVGYGLEGTLPDALAGQIIAQVVRPYFADGKYEEGIAAGVTAIVRASEGEYRAARREAAGSYQRPLTPEEMAALRAQMRVAGVLVLFLVAIFFVVDFFRYRTYVTQSRKYSRHYSFWEWWFRFAILLFVMNILFRMLFYMMIFSRGGVSGSRGGGGGFGGGGGGSFGGGGASGGW